MQIKREELELATTKPIEIIDITDRAREAVERSGLREGLLTLVSRHTTACLNINEREERLLEDMETFLKRLAPRDGNYLHNLEPIDGRDNAHSHLLGLFMNTTETIPFADGKLLLGQWQSIFFIELDGPRPKRGVLMQATGI
ncbi:secondary thiamine-phosphate synthase enzyme YjbQ [Chlorobium sp. N1]|uniref:secondary thiamine-phosphate synthase enzyme YjbQ n=1 Tax=Chlorobium sp. N1 TaxID=2491138 RepID=UPI00103A26C9|nr:secondary thiamine-phosphate synthase enzyme YjbQ [Chlorobium sp. N1]TCD47622.1 YjbQ family protein [Chlorobium sp. N1]